MTTQLGVFAKYWSPGTVKTRLAKSIGAQAASQIYREFVLLLLRRFEHLADRRVLAYAPPERTAEFRQIAGEGWLTEPQHEGDLGQRMQAYFELARESGAQRVVLIGSDSPTVPAAWIKQALDVLQSVDAVIGPSEDGGYYLIGVRGTPPPIFEDIRWSTPDVLPQTLEALTAEGVSHQLLPIWYDIDQLADLRRLQAELQSHRADPLFHPLSHAIDMVLPAT